MAAEEQIFANRSARTASSMLEHAGRLGSEPPVVVGRQFEGLPAHEAGLFVKETAGKIASGDAGLIAGNQDVETFGQSREVLLQQERRCEAEVSIDTVVATGQGSCDKSDTDRATDVNFRP